jgi:2-phosphoglycerate kinase
LHPTADHAGVERYGWPLALGSVAAGEAEAVSPPSARNALVCCCSSCKQTFFEDSHLMIFLLGGPPRVGKSIISSEIRQRHVVSVVSTDTLGAVLENVLSPEAVPDLFVFGKFNEIPMAERVKLILKDPAGLIDYARKESHVIWKAVEAFSRRETDEGRDVLIEGVAVLPELVSQLDDIPHRVVFIGNQGENHKENIKKSAEENERDWMREVGDQYIGAFAMFVKRMSAYIEQEAKKYGFEYIEMDKKPFGDVTEEVMKSLGLK